MRQPGEIKICHSCHKSISGRPYFSRQASMKDWYHWHCFIEACRKANEYGHNQIIGHIGHGQQLGRQESPVSNREALYVFQMIGQGGSDG